MPLPETIIPRPSRRDHADLGTITAGDDMALAARVARLNDFLSLVAADAHDLGKVIDAATGSPSSPDAQEKAERAMHAFHSLSIYRANQLLGDTELTGHTPGVVTMLDEIRMAVNSIRFLPAESYADDLPLVEKELWSALSRYSLASQDMHVRQYDPAVRAVPEALLESLAAICDELVIDTSRRGPQEGFGRKVSRSELAELMAVPGARLFVLDRQGREAGFFIVHTDPSALSLQQRELIGRDAGPRGEERNAGWMAIVGILPGARIALARQGLDAHKLLASAMAQSCFSIGLELLYGEVRGGDCPNTALRGHQRIGMRTCGISSSHEGYTYDLVRLDPLELGFCVNEGLRGEGNAEAADCLVRSALPSLREILSTWEHREVSELTDSEICAPNGSRDDVRRFLERSGFGRSDYALLECSDGLVVQLRGGCCLYSIRQLVPNRDLWTCDFAPDRQRATSFVSALEMANDEMRGFGLR